MRTAAGFRRASAGSCSRGAVRVLLGAVSVGLLALTLSTALFGTTVELLNFAPTFVYITFWLGLPLLSILFGNVWSVLSPWRALADATVWLLERGGREARPVLEWSGAWGRYPAAAALFAFVSLELAHPQPGYPRTLAIAIALYSYWALAGMAVFGRDAGPGTERASPSRSGCSRGSRRSPRGRLGGRPLAVHRPRRRRPRSRHARIRRRPARVDGFDGFNRTSTWSDLLTDLRGSLADSSQRVIDLATTFLNLGGLRS